MKNSSYYIAPVGDRTHDLPHTVASNMVKVSHALNHSATAAVNINMHAKSPNGKAFVQTNTASRCRQFVTLSTTFKGKRKPEKEIVAYRAT